MAAALVAAAAAVLVADVSDPEPLPSPIEGPYARLLADATDLGPTRHSRIQLTAALRTAAEPVRLIAAAAGPFHRFTPEFGPGPPSPANLQIAQDMGKYVNSFAWRGDPPR